MKELFGAIGFIILLGVCATGVASGFMAYECIQYERVTGTPTKFVFMSACYIKVEDNYMHWDEYLAYKTANGLK